MAESHKKRSPNEDLKPARRVIEEDVKIKEDGRSAEILSFWKEEVTNLKGKEFSSVDQAVTTLIERVLDRLNEPQDRRVATQKFLELLFKTDPVMLSTLERILKIQPQSKA